jgi:LemA protein
VAEREGFEPSVRGNRTPDFESGTFNRSATSPAAHYILNPELSQTDKIACLRKSRLSPRLIWLYGFFKTTFKGVHMFWIFFLALLAVALFYGVSTFNGLVALKHNVAKAWSNIDVLLKQRHDELPKLVETCKQYMKYEQDTLEKVMLARSQVANARESHDMNALGGAESGLRAGLGKLFALAEAYPELKANEQFLHLQGRITGLENAISDRREFYNESVNVNNVRIEQFPSNIFAGIFNFKPFDLFKVEEGDTADVDMKKAFG